MYSYHIKKGLLSEYLISNPFYFKLSLRCIVLHTDLAGTVPDTVYDEPIIIEVVSLRYRREITASGQVEHLAFTIAYIRN